MSMKQIERDGSPQRTICALLEELPGSTIKAIAIARGINERAVGRQLDRLVEQGFVRAEGFPQRWYRTEMPLPTTISRKAKSEAIEQRRQLEKQAVSAPFRIPSPGELERVFLTWRSGDPCHAE